MQARADGAGFVLDGVKLFVNDGHLADYLLVAARTGGSGDDGVTLFAIETRRAGITVTPLKTMDQTRKLSEVKFDRVKASAADIVGGVGAGWKTLTEVLDRGKVMLAAEMMGGAQKVLDLTVDYAKVRVQFGRPIGSFQAVQHKCANMMVDIEGAKSAVYYAPWAVSNDHAEAALSASVAKAAASTPFAGSQRRESSFMAASASPGIMTSTCTSNAPNRPNYFRRRGLESRTGRTGDQSLSVCSAGTRDSDSRRRW